MPFSGKPTNGNDTLRGGATLLPSDVIDGLAGIDTLWLAVDYTLDTPNPITHVEIIRGSVGTGIAVDWRADTSAAGITLIGNSGADRLSGTRAADALAGGGGNDRLLGLQGSDLLRGVKGDDTLWGGGGNDVLDETGDTVTSGRGNALNGEQGDDTVWGGAGSDTIQGGSGNDLLLGNGGNDMIHTGTGIDFVFGGQGNDTIYLDDHDSTILHYSTRMANGIDTIYGYTPNANKIRLIALNAAAGHKLDLDGLSNAALTGSALQTAITHALATQQVNGSDRTLTLDNGTSLIFKGVGADLSGFDFSGYSEPAALSSVNSPAITEGNSGTQYLSFYLTLDQAPLADLTVTYRTLTTGTATPNTDFTAISGTLTFAAGERGADISVAVTGDTDFEADETVLLEFFGGNPETTLTGTGTISNDDGAPSNFTLLASATSTLEGRSVTFTITAASAVTTATTLTYRVIGDTLNNVAVMATPDADYTPSSGSITFNPGETSKTVAIEFLDDGLIEGLEGVKFLLFDDTQTLIGLQHLSIAEGVDYPRFTLTTIADNFVGGSGNDEFHGTVRGDNADGTTLQSGDSINGAAGTDTFDITFSASAADAGTTSSLFTLKNVEKILVSNFQSNSHQVTLDPVGVTWSNAIDLALADSSLSSVGLNASSVTGDTRFTGIKNLINAEMRYGSGDLSLAYDSAVAAGSADSQNLTLAGQSSGTFTVDGIEMLRVVAELNPSAVTLAGAQLTAVDVSGSADLQFGTLPAGVEQLDADAFTGNLSVSLGAQTHLSVIGGSGNDTITFSNSLAPGGDYAISVGVGLDVIDVAAGVPFAPDGDLSISNPLAIRLNDFSSGTDRIDVDAPHLAAITGSGGLLTGAAYTAAATGTTAVALATDLTTALTAGGGTLIADGAALLTITGASLAGNNVAYLLINGASAGFSAAEDTVLALMGTSSTTLVTADFF